MPGFWNSIAMFSGRMMPSLSKRSLWVACEHVGEFTVDPDQCQRLAKNFGQALPHILARLEGCLIRNEIIARASAVWGPVAAA